MITEQDLRAAIAECLGERNPNANTCMKFSAYITILNYLYPETADSTQYSFAPEPVKEIVKEDIDYSSETDFGKEINGKSIADVLSVLDEFATTIQMVQPRMFNGLIRKLKEIP